MEFDLDHFPRQERKTREQVSWALVQHNSESFLFKNLYSLDLNNSLSLHDRQSGQGRRTWYKIENTTRKLVWGFCEVECGELSKTFLVDF